VGKDEEETDGMRVGEVVGISVIDWQAASKPIREHTTNGKYIFIVSPFVVFNGSVKYAPTNSLRYHSVKDIVPET
jgi:hypothetical protein